VAVRPRLKICGNTNLEDVALVGDCGADYCGILLNVNYSERSLSFEQAYKMALASKIPAVILLCNPEMELAEKVAEEIRPHAIQLLCRESPAFVKDLKCRVHCQVWKTIHLPVVSGQPMPQDYIRSGADALMVDSVDSSEGFLRMGGTGKVVDWKAAADIVRAVSVPFFLAGGINPQNIEKAILEVRPFGIDLCSGVELSKGKKDPEKVRALVKNFRGAIEALEKGPPVNN
jgi:phosphoribosylanthranilate isomerase